MSNGVFGLISSFQHNHQQQHNKIQSATVGKKCTLNENQKNNNHNQQYSSISSFQVGRRKTLQPDGTTIFTTTKSKSKHCVVPSQQQSSQQTLQQTLIQQTLQQQQQESFDGLLSYSSLQEDSSTNHVYCTHSYFFRCLSSSFSSSSSLPLPLFIIIIIIVVAATRFRTALTSLYLFCVLVPWYWSSIYGLECLEWRIQIVYRVPLNLLSLFDHSHHSFIQTTRRTTLDSSLTNQKEISSGRRTRTMILETTINHQESFDCLACSKSTLLILQYN